ncbi:hypothetical protein BKA63DRAFT_486109 [Paraphoma chrysanthemicola]|nr:hypothetical protein BKA63DRAFT_486109 [Paraphoma chrysanthemicola]
MDLESPRPTKKRYLAGEERQRAVRACRECRRLKEKCEGGAPCKRCRHLRRTCEFNAAPAREERRELRHGHSNEELKDRSVYMERVLRHHLPNLALDIDTLRRTCERLPSSRAGIDQLETSVQPPELIASAPTSESPGIEDENCTLDYVDGATVHYSGEFSHWNFSMHIKRNIDNLMAKSPGKESESVKQVPDFIRVGEPDPGSTSILDIVALLPPQPLSSFLVNIFFKHATSNYYYVDRNWVTMLLETLHTHPNSLSSKDVTAACVVLMVLAVATQYVHLESPKRDTRAGGQGSGSLNAPANWESDIGSAFYRQVARSLSDVIHAGTMLSVQVFLLMGLYSLPIDASGLGYIYLNLAIKVAIQNGMHRKLSRGYSDETTKEIRRCIWWTAYCMESIYHGRPTSIAEAFLHQIASSSRLRSCPRSEVRAILFRIKEMKNSLRGQWTPPPDNAPPSTTRGDRNRVESRAKSHARLECCLLHMFIGRPFILAHRQLQANTQCRHTDAVQVGSSPASATSHRQWDFLIRDCVSAADEVIDICHGMRMGGIGLAKSSYIEYSSCRASLLVLIAHSICCRTNEHSSNLHKGLDAIKEMASVGESAQSEVSLLVTLEEALHRLQAFNEPCGQEKTNLETLSTQDGYEGLLSWYTNVAGSDKHRTNTSTWDVLDTHVPRLRDTGPAQAGLSNNISSSHIPNIPSMDDYPFDLDLLNASGSTAFFTSDLHEVGNTQNDFCESLLWPPT